MSPVRANTSITSANKAVSSGMSVKKNAPDVSFEKVLSAQIESQAGMKISTHARKRLEERNLHLTKEAQTRLGDAMEKIREKGADKSLVLMDDLALVVSARNRVVITAVDASRAKDSVFTNIEGAVIA